LEKSEEELAPGDDRRVRSNTCEGNIDDMKGSMNTKGQNRAGWEHRRERERERYEHKEMLRHVN